MRNHLLAAWQVSRTIAFIYFMILVCGALLMLPDQAQDMIDEFGQQRVDFQFLVKSLSVCVWTSSIWQCARLILLDDTEIDITAESTRWILWLPRALGLVAGLILSLAFFKDGHGRHALIVAGYALVTFLSLLVIEKFGNYQIATGLLKNQATLKAYFATLKSNRMLSNFIMAGTVFMAALFGIFLIPLFWNDFNAGRIFSAVYLVLLGCSFYTGIGAILIYFSNFRNRPIALLIGLYALLITSFNDNTEINQLDLRPRNRELIRSQFGRWLAARRAKPGEVLPMVIIATEGGGIRGAVWTSELLFELNRQIPDFDNYTFAISGVSGGGVGAAFYLAYRADSLQSPSDTLFNRRRLATVLKTDFISPVIGGYLFNESIQILLPVGIKALDRTKRLEDAWSQAYYEQFGKPGSKSTFEKPFTRFYSDTMNMQIPSLLLNGTLAETGQKTIVSNLVTQGEKSFRDVVDIFDLTERDMPYKTAATMCSRFPFVTTGGGFKRFRKSYIGIQSGHVTDGGYFDNTGMETAIQLVTTLLPSIKKLKEEHDILVRPYIIFFKNSESVDLREPDLTVATGFNRGIGIPVSSFYKPWERGSETRDVTYKNLSPYTSPEVKYMALKLDYKKSKDKTQKARLPLGWAISDTAAEHIRELAVTTVSDEVNKKSEFKLLKEQIRTNETSLKMPVSRDSLIKGLSYTRERYSFSALEKGESRRFLIMSHEPYSSSKLEVKEGEIYRIAVPKGQKWTDSFITTTPAGFNWNFPARIAGLRVKNAPCFALCATYNDVEDNVFAIGDQTMDVSIKHNGSLSFFANDVGGFYANNIGSIQIDITRLK